MKALTMFLTIFLIGATTNCEAALEDGYKATCKLVRPAHKKEKGGCGTGTVFHETDKNYYILTAGHVAVNKDRPIFAMFYHNGFSSHAMKCTVIHTSFSLVVLEDDWAILELPKDVYNQKPYPKPSVIPLAKEEPDKDMVLTSVGCARGGWPTGWIGHLRYIARNIADEIIWIKCVPGPVPGRSGSAVMDRDCTMIYGVIVKLTGICVSTEYINRQQDIMKLIGES